MSFEDCVRGALPAAAERELAYLTTPRATPRLPRSAGRASDGDAAAGKPGCAAEAAGRGTSLKMKSHNLKIKLN